MPALVASIESKASEQVEAGSGKKEHRFVAMLVSALTLFAVAVDGYHPYAEDGGLYVAGVKRLLDAALYPHGTEFVMEPTRLSLFAPAVAGIVRLSHLGLPAVLLALHLASVWATLFAAWMLAARCSRKRQARVGAVVLLACWLSLPIAGTALFLIDPYLTARSFSTPCMVLALVGALDMTACSAVDAENVRRRRFGFFLWGGTVVLAAVMHPLMAAYALGATIMLVCVRSPTSSARVWGTAALASAAMALAGWLHEIARPESAVYIRVAMTRTYWFPAEWRWYELVGLAAPLAILTIQAWAKPREAVHQSTEVNDAWQALARMTVAVGATAWVIAVLFARAGALSHLVARMQPLRAFQIVYLVMVLMLGAKLGELVLRRTPWRWCVAMVLLGAVTLGAERGSFAHSDHVELPWIEPGNPWVQAFLWIRENTPKDALFALDADYINAPGEDAQCFRAIAERSAMPDYSKDGGEASIAPELTQAWKIGQAAQQGLSAPGMTDAERLAALGPLGASWVVLQAGAATGFECPYSNSAVRVCHLR